MWMKPECVTIQIKATELHRDFHVELHKVVLINFEIKSVDETLVCDHSYESY